MTPLNIQTKQILSLGLLCLALIIAILYSITVWYADWGLANIHPAVHSAELLPSEDTLKGLPEKHLFGQAIAKLNEVPMSNLQLQVTGIVKTIDEAHVHSKVYLSIAGTPSKIYRIGEKLPFGATIHSIMPNAIILENGGQLEKVLLAREPLIFKPRPQGANE